MRFRKKKEEDVDPTTKRLLEQGIIKVKQDKKREKTAVEKLKEFGMVTYDFWSGVKYIIVLSAILWWLPLFGPMLAGYVGGRRTGGPRKGFFASVVALIAIGIVHFLLMSAYIPAEVITMMDTPSLIVGYVSQYEIVAPYVTFMQMYWGSFFTSILGGLPYSPNSYLITTIFAYIGGMISIDRQRELSRIENEDSTSIMVNVPSLSSIAKSHVPHASASSGQQSKTPRSYASMRSQNWKRESANSAGTSSQKRLDDLKRIQFHSGGRENKDSKRKRSAEVKKKSGSSVMKLFSQKEDKLPNRSVQHHSNSDGDDWEVL